MTKTFCITIDTEPDCDVHWNRSNPLRFDSILVGIPKILRPLWDLYQIHPVYFVSPEVLGDVGCCEVLKSEIKLGAEIGAHLHSEYIEPEKRYETVEGTSSSEFPCFAYSDEIEVEKIKNLTAQIQARLGTEPVSYRAARYGADTATIQSLVKLGYRVDSSVTPGIDWSKIGGPDHSHAIRQPYWVNLQDIHSAGNSSILEVPVSVWGKRSPGLPDTWMFYRWLRPSHMTVFEMRKLINRFADVYEHPVLNMMFHSMEIIPGKTPYVRTVIGQKLFLRRLSKTIEYLIRNGFYCKTLKAIYDAQLQ